MIAPRPREDFMDLQLRMLKTGNPLKYNSLMCQRIQERANKIELPKLTKEEMAQLKEHLSDYKRIQDTALQYEFLNLRNCFLIVSEFETRQDLLQKIRPITTYLDEYRYLFDLIIESQGEREHPTLDKALNILNFDINKFCMRYAYMLTDADTTTLHYATSTPLLDEQDTTEPARDETVTEQPEEPTVEEEQPEETTWEDPNNEPPFDDTPEEEEP